MKHSKKEPNWDTLTITNDHVFFTLMKSPDIAKEILERTLLTKVKEFKYIELQKTVNVLHDAKSIRLDVYLEDEDKIYNIEMQVVENRDLRRRTRFYQSMIDIDNFEAGAFYRDLKDVIILLFVRLTCLNRVNLDIHLKIYA